MFDGRLVGAVQARENGLIDEFGGYYDAYDHLLHLMGEDNDKPSAHGRYILNGCRSVP